MKFLGILVTMNGRSVHRVVLCAAVVLMAACAQNPPAPVVDMTQTIPPAGSVGRPADRMPPAPAGHYIVEKGDTLYSIAFHNQLDWQQLAQWNGIGAPYTIVPGQDLRLMPPPAGSRPVVTYGAKPEPPVSTPAATPTVARTEPSTAEPVVSASAPASATPEPKPAPKPPASPTEPSAAGPGRTVAGLSWHWPAQGSLLSRFVASDPTKQGIDIGGRRGTPVRAAADGVVVYSGNGLVGYGELVIVKHSDTYLSAYGHNAKRLVKEGDRVQAGQEIATMGSSGTSRTELHFEIRKHGQPIDPLGFLPQR